MTIRWGTIGCGSVTEVKSGPGFQLASRSALEMVMRRDAAKAEDYARRHGVPRWTADADALIHDPRVDAVYIATPPGVHLEYALRVAAAGKPAYVEKPMARNHAECLAMIEAFARARQPLFVAYYRRRLPRFLEAKHVIDSGRIGQPTLASVRMADASLRVLDRSTLPWRHIAEHSGGGLVLDVAVHALDILDYLLGPASDVEGTAAKWIADCDVEDVVAMSCRFACGALGTGAWNFASGAAEDSLEITGTLGKLSMSVFGNDPVRVATASGVELFDRPNPPHLQQPLIQTIVDQLHGEGQCPSTGETAARTSWVVDRMLCGYYGGRDDAFWARPATWPGRRGSSC